MKKIFLLMFIISAIAGPTSAKKLTGNDLVVTKPISLTYNFDIEGGELGGTQGMITVQAQPSKTIGLQGQVTYKDDEGKLKTEQFQGTYRSDVEKPILIDMIKAINFGSLSDPKFTDGTLYTRVVMVTHFSSSVMASAVVLATQHDLKPGVYKDPLSPGKLTVSEDILINTPVWMVSQSLGNNKYTVAIRQDNGLPYYYQMTSTDKSGPSRITVRIRSARI